jgi:hypothetical protein
MEIRIENKVLYNQTGYGYVPQEKAKLLISSKKILVIVKNRLEISDPLIAEVRIWR